MAFQSPCSAIKKGNLTKNKPRSGTLPNTETPKENSSLESKHLSLGRRLFHSENYDPNVTNMVMEEQNIVRRQRSGTQGAAHPIVNGNVGVTNEFASCNDKGRFKSPIKSSNVQKCNHQWDAGNGFSVSTHKHICKSRRCAANNPDYATPVPVQPRKFLVSKRHLLQPQVSPACKCCLQKVTAKAGPKYQGTKKRQSCIYAVIGQSKSSEKTDDKIRASNHTGNSIGGDAAIRSNGIDSRMSLIIPDDLREEDPKGKFPNVTLCLNESHPVYECERLQLLLEASLENNCEASTLTVSSYFLLETNGTVAREMLLDENRIPLDQYTDSQNLNDRGCGIESSKSPQYFAKEESLENPILFVYDSSGEIGELTETTGLEGYSNVMGKEAINWQFSLSKALNCAIFSNDTYGSSETCASEKSEGSQEQKTHEKFDCSAFTGTMETANKQDRNAQTVENARFLENNCSSEIEDQLDQEPTSHVNNISCETAGCVGIAAVAGITEILFHYKKKFFSTEYAFCIIRCSIKELPSIYESFSVPRETVDDNPMIFQVDRLTHHRKCGEKLCLMTNMNHSLALETRSCLQLHEEREGQSKLSIPVGFIISVGTNGGVLIRTGLGGLSFSFAVNDTTTDLKSNGSLQKRKLTGNWRLNSIIEALRNISPSPSGQVRLLIRAFETLLSSPDNQRLDYEHSVWKFPECISQCADSAERTYSNEFTCVNVDGVPGANCVKENAGQQRTVMTEDLDGEGHTGVLNTVDAECHCIKRKHARQGTETFGEQQFKRQCPGVCNDHGVGIRWSFGVFGCVEYESRFIGNEWGLKSKFENAHKIKARDKVSKPQPFSLCTEERGQFKDQQFAKKIEIMFAEEEKLRKPIAQCLPWTTNEPEILSKPPAKEQTKSVEFHLMTGIRAFERAKFDTYVAAKLSFLEQQRTEVERLRKIAEMEDIKKMRKEMIPRAQLMPYFDRPFIPKRSSKPLTVPKDPQFHYTRKKRAKCMNCDGVQVIL